MSRDELKSVEKLYRFLRKWETEDLPPTESELERFREEVSQLSSSSKIEIKKLATLAEKFRLDISPRELFNLAIPFERALSKSLRDDEFLVSHWDTTEKGRETYPLILVLENLRSAFNVGAFFRTAEALGVQEIWLTGYTASPENEKIQKTTMGSDAWIPWKSHSSTESALKDLKSKGIRIIGLETSQKAQALDAPFTQVPTAFIFGNERFGLDLKTLQSCDELRKIPLSGHKNSLNVASCGAICSYEWIRQWKNSK